MGRLIREPSSQTTDISDNYSAITTDPPSCLKGNNFFGRPKGTSVCTGHVNNLKYDHKVGAGVFPLLFSSQCHILEKTRATCCFS